MDKAFTLKISTVLVFIARIAAIALVILAIYLWRSPANPAPAYIKKQINFKVIFPRGNDYKIKVDSWKYQTDQKSLAFSAATGNTTMVITEQKTRASLENNSSAYHQLITSIRPYSQFSSPVGDVALTKFWTSGDFQNLGQTAVLNSHGTFLIAHPNKDLTEEQWQTFFASLKIGR